MEIDNSITRKAKREVHAWYKGVPDPAGELPTQNPPPSYDPQDLDAAVKIPPQSKVGRDLISD